MAVTLLVCWFGLLHGLRHAFEPDHVAAVSTFVAEQRSVRQRVAYSLSWGVGHGFALLVAGVVLFSLRAEMPPRLESAFELFVAAILVGLGIRGLWIARASVPPGAKQAGDQSLWAPRALLVGVAHGLAGSGAVTALVVTNLVSMADVVILLGLYGLGATLGMGALGLAASLPLGRFSSNHGVAAWVVRAAAVTSLTLGVVWGASPLHRLLS